MDYKEEINIHNCCVDSVVLFYNPTGGGINERNLQRILEGSGVTEFHASARSSVPSGMTFRKDGISMGAALTPPEFNAKVTDSKKVVSFLNIAKDFIQT